jgi:uncharacterized protein (DUF433 family)
MQLEDYFEFEKLETKFGAVERIRVKGHRVSIEHVIDPFLKGFSPDVIARDYYPTLSLEQVYATIIYYLHNQSRLDEYFRRGEMIASEYEQECRAKGPFSLRDEAVAGAVPPAPDTIESPHG